MRRGAPRADWEGRPAISRDGDTAGSVLRAHGDGQWPDTLVLDLGARRLAVPAANALLTREEVRLPWPTRRLHEARPLDAEAHEDAAAVARAAAAFEDPSRTPIREDADAMTLSEERL